MKRICIAFLATMMGACGHSGSDGTATPIAAGKSIPIVNGDFEQPMSGADIPGWTFAHHAGATGYKPSLDHDDPAHLMMTGTGLTHLGSAEGRDQMHRKAAAAETQTDSMRMFLEGVAGGKPYLVYGFNMVFLSKIDWSAGSGDDEPNERLTFAYGALAIGYYPQQADGSLGTAVKASWNRVTNSEAPPDILTGF